MTEDVQEPAPAEQSPVPPANEPTSETTVNDQDAAQEAEQNEPKPEEPKEPPKRSRREALEKAFADVGKAEGEEGKDEEVEGKNGSPTGPNRGADGKFAAKDAEKDESAAEKTQESDKPKDEGKDAGKPNEAPQRFSADAKAEWDKAPKSVQAETQRAIREMERGIDQYKQRIEPLEPFYKMAEQSGTKLEDAIGRYVNLENMLRQDPARGFTEIARNMGVSPQQVGQMLLGQQPGQADPRDQELHQLRQQVQQLQQGFGGVQQNMQQQQEQAVHKQIEEFAAQNPRFEELSNDIAEMLSTGYAKDLQDAYEKADRLNPAAPQPEAASETPAQTRQVKSVTGAPSPGSNPAHRKPSKSRTEALERAMRSAGF